MTPGEVAYSMVTIVTQTVSSIWKLLSEYILKVLMIRNNSL